MWTLTDYTKGSGVALYVSVGLKLAALLGGHVFAEERGKQLIDRQGRLE